MTADGEPDAFEDLSDEWNAGQKLEWSLFFSFDANQIAMILNHWKRTGTGREIVLTQPEAAHYMSLHPPVYDVILSQCEPAAKCAILKLAREGEGMNSLKDVISRIIYSHGLIMVGISDE